MQPGLEKPAAEIGAIGIAGELLEGGSRRAHFETAAPCWQTDASTDYMTGRDQALKVDDFVVTSTARAGIERGDSTFHRAIAASWSFPYQRGRVQVAACFVLD